ncbi:hypothetical protein AVEN_68600-1 [Araneus ventricosus]|uniref:Uncharacterized protein n=1 Tax=Araneus ventricosus TaxID=182803 RepID=A0A4Y2QGR2_ARAVE|nr:hypothetical protein AVEN_68600-1 [Araneus ventricosus]
MLQDYLENVKAVQIYWDANLVPYIDFGSTINVHLRELNHRKQCEDDLWFCCYVSPHDGVEAGKSTKVVGAVLGTLLGIVIILIIVYIVRQRKNSYSEDSTPAPRVDNSEMIERRPMRG